MKRLPPTVSFRKSQLLNLNTEIIYHSFRYTVLPNTKFGRFWEGLIFVTAFITVLTVSLQAGFVYDQPALWTINYLLDVIFFADMSVLQVQCSGIL